MREGGSTRADGRPGLCKTCAFCIVQVHFNPICSCNYAFHKNGHRRSTRAELSNMFAGKREACVHISLKSWNGGLPFILVGFGSSQGYIFQKNTKKNWIHRIREGADTDFLHSIHLHELYDSDVYILLLHPISLSGIY